MKQKFCLLTLFFILLPSWLLFAELVAGVNEEFPPFSSLENTTLIGCDVELLQRIAEETHSEIKIVSNSREKNFSDLSENKIQLYCGVQKTKDLEDKYDFTIPYGLENYVLIVNSSSDINGIMDLENKSFARYSNDYAIDEYIRLLNFKTIRIPVQSFVDALSHISREDADFTIAAAAYAKIIIHKLGLDKQLKIVRPLFPIEYRIAVSKNKKDILFALNEALAKLSRSGYLREIGISNKIIDNEQWQIHYYLAISLFLVIASLSIGVYFYLKKKQNSIRLSMEGEIFQLRAVLDALPLPIFWTDENGKTAGQNSAWKTFNPSNDEKDEYVTKQFSYKVPNVKGNVCIYTDVDNERELRDNIARLSQDITKKEARIAELEITDTITGLFNLKFIYSKIADEILSYDRTGQKFCAVLFYVKNVEAMNFTKLKIMSSKILESLGSSGFCGYAGFSRFVIVFPHQKKDMVDVFVEGTIELVKRDVEMVDVDYKSFEYYGQGIKLLCDTLQIKQEE